MIEEVVGYENYFVVFLYNYRKRALSFYLFYEVKIFNTCPPGITYIYYWKITQTHSINELLI